MGIAGPRNQPHVAANDRREPARLSTGTERQLLAHKLRTHRKSQQKDNLIIAQDGIDDRDEVTPVRHALIKVGKLGLPRFNRPLVRLDQDRIDRLRVVFANDYRGDGAGHMQTVWRPQDDHGVECLGDFDGLPLEGFEVLRIDGR